MYSHDRIAIQRMLIKIDLEVVAQAILNWFERLEAEIWPEEDVRVGSQGFSFERRTESKRQVVLHSWPP